MVYDMNLEGKVFLDTDSPTAVRALFLAPVPSDRVAGGIYFPLRQRRRVLQLLFLMLLPLLRYLYDPRSDP